MAQLARCDRCGSIRKPDSIRPVTIFFCDPNGLVGPDGYFEWDGGKMIKGLKADLCASCWKEFVEGSKKFFDIK